ncbi:MAG: alpha-amylase family glycosyl hydrolase, partial [Candidatus Eisenbacteria bacterium]
WTDTAAIAEYFGATDSIARGDELPCNFDFPLAASIVDGVKSGDARGIAGVLREIARAYPAKAIDAPFLTNHDMARVATQVGNRRDRLGTACAILFTLPGAPFVYYGEEIGMENGPGADDKYKRTPMAWTGGKTGGFSTGEPWFAFAPGREHANVATERKESGSLLRRYISLIRLRSESPALRKGAISLLTPTDRSSPVLAFERVLGVEGTAGAEWVLVAHNLSDRPVTAGPFEIAGDTFRPLFADRGVGIPSSGSGGVTVRLPAHSTGVWKIEGKGTPKKR